MRFVTANADDEPLNSVFFETAVKPISSTWRFQPELRPRVPPDVADALVSDRRVNDRVRDRAMAHESLQRSCIDSTGAARLAYEFRAGKPAFRLRQFTLVGAIDFDASRGTGDCYGEGLRRVFKTEVVLSIKDCWYRKNISSPIGVANDLAWRSQRARNTARRLRIS